MFDEYIYVFIRRYSEAIMNGNAAVFAGAGLSVPSGFVNWKELMRPFAAELGLSIDLESDYLDIAQYYCNVYGGRHRLNHSIMNSFSNPKKENDNADILARLPISTYWTTNYDQIIEKYLQKYGRDPDVKISEANLAITHYSTSTTVYKLHGDISLPENTIVTKDDYESFDDKRSLFSIVLGEHLLSKTFLFIGYSFEDPDFLNILSKMKKTLSQNVREHYYLLKKPQRFEYETNVEFRNRKRRVELQIQDLRRYGIQTVLLDSYDEIPNLLLSIEDFCKMKTLFISGAISCETDKWTLASADVYIQNLSELLIKNKYKIVSGFGLGCGSSVVSGLLNAKKSDASIHFEDCIRLYPFPTSKKLSDSEKHEYRKNMIEQCGIAVFAFGNKLDAAGNVILSDGMIEEFKIARSLGAKVIPVASTGLTAEYIYNQMMLERESYLYLDSHWQRLAESLDPEQLTIVRIKTLKERTYDAIGDVFVDKLTYRQIQGFILSLSKDGVNQKTGKGLSQKSQKQYLTFISDVLKYGKKCRFISENPCIGISTVKSVQDEKDIYSIDELRALLNAIDRKASTNYKVFFYLLAYCGLRRGEALGIEYRDIDFETGLLSISRTSNYQKDNGVYTDSPKTKSSYRQLILQPKLLSLIRELEAEQNEQAMICGDQWYDTGRLFVTWCGKPMHPNTPYTWLQRFCEAEGLQFKGLHSFRHSMATQAITNGVDIKTVSAILGHSQTSTTLNIYTHAVQQTNVKALNILAELIDGDDDGNAAEMRKEHHKEHEPCEDKKKDSETA